MKTKEQELKDRTALLFRTATERKVSSILIFEGEDLLGIKGVTPHVIRRYGDAIPAALRRGEAVPETELPVPPRRPRPVVPAAVRQRIERLRAWRAAAARRLGLDPGVLLPGRLI